MRIAHINTYFDRGGTSRVMCGIVAAASAAGHECMVAAGRGVPVDGVECYRIGSDAETLLNAVSARLLDNDGFAAHRATRRLVDRLDAFCPDVIHLHNLHGYYLDVELLFDYLRRRMKRVVWTLHDCWAMTGHCAFFTALGCNEWESGCRDCRHIGAYPRCITAGRPAHNFDAKKRVFSGISNLCITTPSEWLAGLVEKSYLSDYETVVIPNGVDLNRFAPRKSSFRERYGIGSRTMLLGVASKWQPAKGLDDFIALASILGEEYAIVMVGVDNKLKRRLPPRIIATPALGTEELAEAYTAADLLLNLSREESFGLVTLESLACGTPVLVYDVAACPEPIVSHPECGITVSRRQGLAGVINAIGAASWRRITAACCIAQASRYAASSCYTRFLTLYK